MLAGSACQAGEGGLPAIISAGFNQYARYGADPAWTAWKIDYGDKNPEKKASFLNRTKDAEKRYGRMVGFELIHVNDLASSYKNVYVLWRFEKAPLFCLFVCYRGKDDWRIMDFSFGDDPRAFLPKSILELPGY
jgi:hypothetical protein